MKKLKLFIPVFIFVLAFTLRYNGMTAHAPFDWDQDRDYAQVVRIARGDLVVLGPVAKGVGGFYLGSLYYYLLYPAYALMAGSLSALPLTSVLLDSLMTSAIYLLLSHFATKKISFFAAIFWACSAHLIGAARISWNVALVPLWSLLTLFGLLKLITSPSSKRLYLLAFLTGLSAHIHVAAIPLIPLFLTIYHRQLHLPLSVWLKAMLVALIPVLPLILFDLTHNFQNTHLLLFQIKSQATAQTKLLPFLAMVIIKLGKVVNGLIFARFANSFWLGIGILALAARAASRDHRLYLKLSGITLTLSTILVLALHDYGFPEYYFAPSYLAIYLLVITGIGDLAKRLKIVSKFSFLVILTSLLITNLVCNHQAAPGGYSLGVKQEIVSSLTQYPFPLDIHYQFQPGRDGGLQYLVELVGIEQDPQAEHRLIITDNVSYPAYIEGELAEDQIQIGDLKTALYIVQ